VGGSETWQFQLPLPADMPIGEHRLRVFVAEAEGAVLPETSHNDELSFSFGVYENSVERSKVYMEVYTDQTSLYVPFLNSAMSQILSGSSTLADKLAVANVHRPGTPLAIDAGAYLHELYAYTWPTFTSNRSYFPMEEHIAYDMNDYLLYGDDFSISIIGGIIAQDLSMPSFATVDLQADYAADSHQLTVTATGTTLPEAEAICGDLALTLLLVEDGVKGEQVVYNALTQQATTNRNYQHNQVLRGYMTQPTGDRIDISGDRYTFSRTLTLDSGWQADKLTVIALLTKYADTVTADNVLDMDVINCNSIALSAVMGMAPIRTEVSNDSDTWYSLSGQRVKPTGKGVFIHNGKKILR
jgi:hypothetical protein